jgi:FecR protein
MTSAVASDSHRLGASKLVSAAIAVAFTVAVATCLIIPNEVDEALGRTATTISDKKEIAGQTWASVVSTIATEADEGPVSDAASIPNATVLKHGAELAAGTAPRTILTSGHDIIELDPQTRIRMGGEAEGPATIIELQYGTIHVKAAKRAGDKTLSVETPFLVATVKGTQFDVTTTDSGTAVSVTEGLVSVRSAHSQEAVDITSGYTAVVSVVHGLLPTTIATASGGALAAIEAAVAGTVSNSNHHRP